MFKLTFGRMGLKQYEDKQRKQNIILILYPGTGEYVLFDSALDKREIGSYYFEKGMLVLKPEYLNGKKVGDNVERVVPVAS